MMDSRDKILFEPPEIGCVLSLTGLPGAGSKIYDRSPYGNIGAIVGATWVRLSSGLWCLSFDGVDDWVNCGTKASLSPADIITVEAWLNPATVSGDHFLLSKTKSNADGGYSIFWRDTELRFSINGTHAHYATVTITADKWCYIVGTYDKYGGSDNIKIYLNAEQGDPATLAETIDYTDAGPFYIARFPGGGARGSGLIALIRVHNRALSALEIQNHFNQEKHLFGVW